MKKAQAVNEMQMGKTDNVFARIIFLLVGLTVSVLAAASDWESMGGMPGTDGTIYAIVRSGSNIYVGGKFSIAGNVNANNIAKWNGSSWSAIGSGTNGQVNALEIDGRDNRGQMKISENKFSSDPDSSKINSLLTPILQG